MSRVDIITPAFNAAETLQETIDSVLAQQEQDWRYFIIDDGSTDTTASVVEGYLHDPRIHLIRQQNQGVAGALNRGLEQVSADYVAMLGADDIWAPGFLSTLCHELDNHPDCGLVWCDLECFGATTGLYRRQRTPVVGDATATLPLIFSDITFLASGSLCRAQPFKQGLRHPHYRAMEDIHVWAAIAAYSTIRYVAEPLSHYRVHDGSLSTSRGSMLRNYESNVASYRSLYRDYCRYIPRKLYRQRMWWCHHYAAEDLMHLGRPATRALLRALRFRPTCVATWKNLIKCVLRRQTAANSEVHLSNG